MTRSRKGDRYLHGLVLFEASEREIASIRRAKANGSPTRNSSDASPNVMGINVLVTASD